MKIFTLLLSLVFATSAVAQNGPVPLTIQPSSSSMMRSGWTSPVYSKLKWVPDPKSVTTANVEPERKDAGYWPDMQAPGSQQSGVVLLHFVAGTTLFAKGQDNDRALAILEHTFYNTALVEQMEYVTIVAAASPEGNTSDNELLAASRALAIKEHIMRMFPYLDRDRIVTYSAGEDWSGLKKLIEEDLYVPGRDAALRLLSSPLPGNLLRERLVKIAGGETYGYIEEHLFPKLRGGAACLIYFKDPAKAGAVQQPTYVKPQPVYQDPVDPSYIPEPQKPKAVYVPAAVQQEHKPVAQQQPVVPQVVVPAADPQVVAIVPDQPSQHQSPVVEKTPVASSFGQYNEKRVRVAKEWVRQPIFDIKTNLIYDLSATVSLGAEVKLADQWSLELMGNYNGWNFSKQRMWRHWMVQPEARYWLKDAMQTGHFFGAHVAGGQYNVKFDNDPKGKRFEGTGFGAGVAYGYRWNLGKASRWALEATLGLGFASLRYDILECAVCNGYGSMGTGDTVTSKDVKKTFIGPTKVGINLVYRVGGSRK